MTTRLKARTISPRTDCRIISIGASRRHGRGVSARSAMRRSAAGRGAAARSRPALRLRAVQDLVQGPADPFLSMLDRLLRQALMALQRDHLLEETNRGDAARFVGRAEVGDVVVDDVTLFQLR